MARRRRRGSRHHATNSVMGWVNKLVTPAAFGVSFVGQLTAKDVQGYPGYATLPNVEKGKFLLNSVLGRTASFNPFPQYGTPQFTINPTGPINKYTGMGIGLLVLGHVLPKGIGGKSIAKKAGKGLFWGGVIGGFFDPATGQRSGGASVRRGPGGLAAIGASSVTGHFGTQGLQYGSYIGTGSSSGY